MAETRKLSFTPTDPSPKPNIWFSLPLLLLTLLLPISISLFFHYHQPQDFNPIPLAGYSFGESIGVPTKNERAVGASERVGDGLLPAPEDLAFDGKSGYIYTGCHDGWVRRVRVVEGDDEVSVEDWVRVGGRLLGVALGPDGSLVVAEADKGLLLVKADREVHLLTDEAEGLKFGLTDGVDVASDGMIYFTDASYKYSLDEHLLDIFEGRPHGRLMSFDPSTNQTVVLVRDLYFANGVSLSPDQESLIFCETSQRRCKRYYIQGDKKGTVEKFVENLPGFPDNIRYDGEGRYWIGLSAGRSLVWDLILKYPLLRKIVGVVGKFVEIPHTGGSGVMSASPEGKPLELYSDPGLNLVTGGLKIGNHLYYGSLVKPYISRIDLTKPV